MKPNDAALEGLSDAEAARRLLRDGPNELPSAGERTLLPIALDLVREPMFLLLLTAGAVYLAIGDRGDALMLLGFVCITMAITIVQERRTERVLQTLRDLSSPRALVIRGGRQVRIAGRDLVRGDLLVLEEGDRIAADGELLECHDLLVDESLMTGESIAVSKMPQEGAAGRVYSGSMVLQGGGLARVAAIGDATEIGKIGRSLESLAAQPSPLQQEIRQLVRRFALSGAALSLLALLLYGWTRGDWLNSLLAGLTLAMSMLPEEFTVVLTVFMALGAWRISRHHVLTRHTPVIEALGSATVLCVDKTGTLTQNRMSVKALSADEAVFTLDDDRRGRLPAELNELLDYALLASEVAPFDPMEKAIHQSHAGAGVARHEGWAIVHEYPLTADCMAMTHVWQAPGSRDHVVATKGAPEAVARLCRLDAQQTALMLARVQAMAGQGMRVLAVARACHPGGAWPATPAGFEFAWLGLVGLADPIRPQVNAAVALCRQAGIRVVMITGDYPATAQAIARDAGLPFEQVVTGAQLDALDDAALGAAVRSVHVFARILPQQKLRLVNALKDNGEVVAMTGDGVNDAPALKAAHIGISMGERGTDVAREASSLVLLDDDFASIVHAVKLGRRIYDNLQKAMVYIVAAHMPIAGMTLLPLLLGTPLAFAPVHIVFLEMVINPTCALVFETEEAERDIMRRAPRALSERLFGLRNLLLALLQGLGLLAAIAAVFFTALHRSVPEEQGRALAFVCLITGSSGLMISSRSARHGLLALLRMRNQVQWWILAGTGAGLAAALAVPALRQVFHFAPVSMRALALGVLAGLAAVAWFELVKSVFRTRHWAGVGGAAPDRRQT
jgi:Ca2+-transporting ATPase